MADRLTQLQEAVNQLGDLFCNSVGVLQQSGAEQAPQNESKDPQVTTQENAAHFSHLIARTAQDIDILIDSLPNQEYTPEKQVESLRKLQVENQQSAERLAKAVEEGETLLERIREALKEICDSQLGINEDKPKR